jgi:cell division septum initiation protein DivIVA
MTEENTSCELLQGQQNLIKWVWKQNQELKARVKELEGKVKELIKKNAEPRREFAKVEDESDEEEIKEVFAPFAEGWGRCNH